MALRVNGLKDLRVYDMGDVEMYSGDAVKSCENLEKVIEKIAASGAIPLVLGGDHTVTWPNVTGVARGADMWGRVGVIHFDAHADTGDIAFGSLVGHGQPMRLLIDSGAVRGDRFIQVGLRGYWPPPEILDWMAAQGMRSYEMTEITHRGLKECVDEAIELALRECDAIYLSVDIDVVDPGSAPGTGTPEPGGLTSRELLDTVRRMAYQLPIVGVDVVEVSPPYDHADITALLGNRVVLEVLSWMARRRKDDRDGTTWNPGQPILDGS
jgi:agmatinase